MTKKIEFTDRAKEQIEKIISADQLKKFFRISVKGGGCSGFKYDFSFDNKVDSKDIVFGKAVIDKASLDIISGSTICPLSNCSCMISVFNYYYFPLVFPFALPFENKESKISKAIICHNFISLLPTLNITSLPNHFVSV